MYREYVVMQPLQRSYSITEASIERMLQKGALKGLWDEAKVAEYEEQGNALSGKDQNKLQAFYATKPVYDAILVKLQEHIADENGCRLKHLHRCCKLFLAIWLIKTL